MADNKITEDAVCLSQRSVRAKKDGSEYFVMTFAKAGKDNTETFNVVSKIALDSKHITDFNMLCNNKVAVGVLVTVPDVFMNKLSLRFDSFEVKGAKKV